uniref:Uncharacterized protein n=1 Tax=Vitis vinifera TaxID=29760 RepID=A5BY37_VITVI|nr:hypothetical protein VITISV_036860 [Vitis vinifera]
MHKKGCEITSQQKADFAALQSWLSACGVRLPMCRNYQKTLGGIPQHCAKWLRNHFATKGTLASVLVVSLGGIVSSAEAMGFDGFRSHFEAWRSFRSKVAFSQTISQLQNTLRNGALAAKLGVFMLRNCKMRVTVLRNGTRVPKSGFAAVKSFAKWSFPCENGIFHALVVRSRFAAVKWKSLCWEMALPFRCCEMRFTVLRNGTCVPKVGFAAAKYPAKWSFGCEIGIFHVLELRSCEMGAPVLRSGTCVPKLVSQLRKFS